MYGYCCTYEIYRLPEEAPKERKSRDLFSLSQNEFNIKTCFINRSFEMFISCCLIIKNNTFREFCFIEEFNKMLNTCCCFYMGYGVKSFCNGFFQVNLGAHLKTLKTRMRKLMKLWLEDVFFRNTSESFLKIYCGNLLKILTLIIKRETNRYVRTNECNYITVFIGNSQ